jgi:branched-chain amino acid transport system substrate-binding protein
MVRTGTQGGDVRRRRLIVAAALLSAAALLTAACGSEGDGGGQASACSAEGLQAIGKPKLPTAKDFQLAGNKVTPGRVLAQAKKTFKIGYIGDISGGNSGLVIPSRDSVKLAIDQANAKGDLPVTLAYVPIDNKDAGTDPSNTSALVRRFITDPAVVGVVGPAFSGETEVGGPLLNEAGLTFITPSATNPDLTKKGWKAFFRGLATDAVQGSQTATLIVDVLGCKKVAVVNDKSPYGSGLAKATAAGITKAGGEVVLNEGVEPTTDYTALIDSVIAADPDVLYYGGYDQEAPLVAKQYKDKGGEGLFIGGDGDKGTNFLKEGGEAVEGAVLTCPCLDPNASADAAAQKFATDYKTAFGKEAGIYSSEAWDAAQIFIAAIKAGGANTTRASVLQYVTALKDFKGLAKTYNWTAVHEVGGNAIYAYIVKDGKYSVLGLINDLPKKSA